LDARARNLRHFTCQAAHALGIDTESRRAGHHLAAQFEEDALVLGHI
jgi:hypothetical protein